MDRILKKAYRLVISWLSQRKDNIYCFPKALKKLSMLLLKWNAFSCAYMFFIKFACSPKCFSLSFVHYYNSKSVKISLYVLLWWHVPMQCLFVIATIMRNSLNFKITSLIFEMIFTANGKFIHFPCLKTQRNMLW